LYGYGQETSPHLDDFFQPGSVFENARSPAPCTVPAVEQVLTSRLDRRGPRTAEYFADSGYQTAAVVSQHFFRDASGPLPPVSRGFGYFDVQAQDDLDEHGMTRRSAASVSDGALAWLRGRARDTKFFLWLHYFDPHDPYRPPPAHRNDEAAGVTLDGDRRARQMAHTGPDEMWTDTGDLFSPEENRHLRSRYDAEIRYVDAELRRVLEFLAQDPGLDRVEIWLWSDHGERLGEDGVWDHCISLADLELRVPLAVVGPGIASARIDASASTLDVLPTLIRRHGLRRPPEALALDLDGHLLPGLFGEGPESRFFFATWDDQWLVAQERWKLIVPPKGAARLIHTPTDPTDGNDVSGEHPQVAARLLQALADRLPHHAGVVQQNREVIEHLRAMGYVE
jgi:arylsulfatase A-like enzyme